MNPNLPLYNVETMEGRVSESLALERMVRTLLTGLGLLAVVLAASGIFGVVSYFVSRRIPEMGLRMALGASSSGLSALVVRQSMGPVVVGLAIGIVLSILAAGQLGVFLFGVAPTDPITLGGSILLVAAIGGGAAWLPARRAARVDPMRALGAD